AQPLTDVLNDLIAQGAYQKVLETWNLGPEAISEAKTNPQGLPKSGS
ncbi:MAG: ABC transporter substrate-binding protein, partial [Phyllobacterium sp.]